MRFEWKVFVKHRIMQVQRPDQALCDFLVPETEISSKAYNLKTWKIFKGIQWHRLSQNQMRNFIGVPTNGKLTGVKALNAKGSIFMKVIIWFIVYFNIGKYNFNFDTFEYTSHLEES